MQKKGQIGLLLIVVIGVVVAIVMSISSTSLSDTVLSRQEKESGVTFAQAEAGVEKALNELRLQEYTTQAVTLPTSMGYVDGKYQIQNNVAYELYIKEGESAYLDLSAAGSPSSITIKWTKKANINENIATCIDASGSAPAAIEVSASSASTTKRSYYNAYGCALSANGFLNTATTGATYLSQITNYAVPPGTTSIKIKPIYTSATISVSGTGLSGQLYKIQSAASGGDSKKEIEVKRGLDSPPSIFDYAVFSGTNIVK